MKWILIGLAAALVLAIVMILAVCIAIGSVSNIYDDPWDDDEMD